MAPNDPSVDEIIAKILSCSDATSVTKTLAPFLNNLNEQFFSACAPGQTDPLDALSPDVHSFAYLYFLYALQVFANPYAAPCVLVAARNAYRCSLIGFTDAEPRMDSILHCWRMSGSLSTLVMENRFAWPLIKVSG